MGTRTRGRPGEGGDEADGDEADGNDAENGRLPRHGTSEEAYFSRNTTVSSIHVATDSIPRWADR